MKIEIDTKHDSPEEIKKVIKMLHHLVGEHAYSNQPNIFEDSEPSLGSSSEESGSNAFLNIFGNAGEPKEEPMDEPKEEPMDEEKKAEEVPEVIPY